MKLLYVTADGLLEPLCFSQVVRVVDGLAKRGWQYHLLSMEKPHELADTSAVRALRRRLSDAGIGWTPLSYDWSGSTRAALGNMKALVSAAVELTKRHHLDAVHARAYHGAFAASAVWLAHRTPYVFDARSYWFDERLEEGRWLTSPFRLGVARGIEHSFFANAAAVVTLTELQADDVRGGRFGNHSGQVVTCIPTCADYDDFVRRPVETCLRVPSAIRATLRGKRVLGIVGSLNRSYLVDASLELAKRIIEAAPDTHLLVLTAQVEAYQQQLAAHGLSPTRSTVASAPHDAMPEWLSLIDWGLLLLKPNSPAKRASMPTKLAEFFAMGVRPIHYGCNAEVGAWVAKAGSGFVLPDVQPSTLAAAAKQVVSTPTSADTLASARAMTAPHFALSEGIAKYDEVLRKALGSPATSSGALG